MNHVTMKRIENLDLISKLKLDVERHSGGPCGCCSFALMGQTTGTLHHSRDPQDHMDLLGLGGASRFCFKMHSQVEAVASRLVHSGSESQEPERLSPRD